MLETLVKIETSNFHNLKVDIRMTVRIILKINQHGSCELVDDHGT